MTFRVYIVASRSACGGRDLAGCVAEALSALPGGGAAVQLREKGLPAAAVLALARELAAVCRAHGSPLLVNDRADVALATGCGVHLPADGLPPADARALLGPDALIGVSCHSAAELDRAEAGGASFAVFGPVWASPGKSHPIGPAALGAAARDRALPVFALGGVDASNAGEALRAGAKGVACVRAVLGAADVRAAAADLWRAVEAAA